MSNKLKGMVIFLIVVTIGVGMYSHKLNIISKEVTPIKLPNIEKIKVEDFTTSIYLPNPTTKKLYTEEISIDGNLMSKDIILNNIVKQLINNLEEKSILKKGSYKYEVYLKNKDIYLDLDSKILLSAKDPQEEILLIYSFVNSLLTPGGFNKVVILVDGNPVEKVNFINISKSYKLNKDI
nr:GerMN domain-containing protein [uncultured Cetobacterium sp.]